MEKLKEEWGFLNSGSNDAAVNMALDEALLLWHSKGDIPPSLRFYSWNNPTLSVGKFQKVETTIDFESLKRYQCQYVRRLTGGSAVLHDDELTYSIVISEAHPEIPRTIRDAYYILSKGVLEGYKNLGIYADYAIPKDNLKPNSPVCFEKTAYYEMIVDEKKISGNAQTRKKGVLLQHGSIPMSIDTTMLFDMFLYPNEEVKLKKQDIFLRKATTIDQLTNKIHTYQELVQAFYKGFQDGLNISLKPLHLSKEQWCEVYDLAINKYQSEAFV